MSTGAYLPGTVDLVAGDHGQVMRAAAMHPDFPAPVDLAVVKDDWSVTFDESATPRVTARLRCAVPAGALPFLDGRKGVRVDLVAGYMWPGEVEDTALLADLGLRARDLDVRDDLVDLALAGDEALVIDASPAVTGSRTGTPHTIITNLLKSVISPAPRIVLTGSAGASTTVDPVTDVWDTVSDMADRIGELAGVFDDGTRTFYVASRPIAAGTVQHALTTGPGGTVTAGTDTLSRDDWFNYVTLRYRWRSGTTDNQVLSTAYVQTGDYAITGPAGKRAVVYDRATPTTQAEANAAARAVLARALTRANTVRLSAVNAFWLRPGDTITVDWRDGAGPLPYLVSRVTFTGRGTMDLYARAPELAPSTVETSTPSGSSPTADPAPAATQTYVSTWVANASMGYKGSGAQRTDGELAQGYTPYTPSNGNCRSVVLFTAANATGDNAGQTVSAALSGAKVIKIELGLTAVHWHSFAGGYARLGYYPGTTIPGTYTGGAPYVKTSKWGVSSRVINMTSSAFAAALKAGTSRGVTIGPGVGTDTAYYGKFAPHDAGSGKPFLRITYAK